ncbi:MAG: phenylalanine--tRNA ligase subunit alpha [Myxococcales bacterium]|nr:phenylalanine--tRNA ligase subunit alpha [Myxococcales bacterium]
MPQAPEPEKLDVVALVDTAERELAAAATEQALREVHARYGGREGAIKRAVQAAINAAPKDRKREVGQVGNAALQRIEGAFEARLRSLGDEARTRDLARTVDVTLPGRSHRPGHLHPITHARRAIERIFAQLGFTLATGPQVETDFHNFEALAMPPDHPARDMQDTFYLANSDLLLRTHTSPVQIRTMLAQRPPVRVICPGTVYRRDDDPTHSPMFHQVEGLLVDEQVTFADLKGVLLHFARAFFGPATTVRLRPSFFPFTEPSAEFDLSCVFCAGAGCRTCKNTGWIEVGGAGMVDPEVFRHVDYDSERYTGFAFGFGIDRMAMLKYRISDIRLLYEGDHRLLEQFP